MEQQDQQEVIIPSTQKPKTNFLILTIIFVGVLLTISLLYFGYQFSLSKKSNSIVPTPLSQGRILQDETANWETYSNKEFNFLIKYPSEWIIDSNVGTNKTQTVRFFQSILGENNEPKIIPKMEMYVGENTNKVTLEDIEKDLKDPKKFETNGVIGLRGYYETFPSVSGNEYTGYIITKDLFIIFKTSSKIIETNENIVDIFDKILFTFKVLN